MDKTPAATVRATSFWQKLKKRSIERGTPIVVMAPMADVTDAAFRRIIAKYSNMGGLGAPASHVGGPDVLWTEFVSADGLCSPGRQVLERDLAYSEGERPIVAQLFTSHPEKMREAAALCEKLGFDGIDINMGCPDKSIEKQGAGAAMMRDPAAAVAVIRAAKAGAPSLPISVKTRVGYNRVELETWLPILLAEDLAVITVHARTRKEMSDVPARWEHVKRAVEIRDALRAEGKVGKDTLIFGNGDVKNLVEAAARARETGADGVMIGRGIFGNPWLFNFKYKNSGNPDGIEVTIPERLRVMVEHTKLFMELLGDIKSFAIMKKHYKAYVHGWDGSKELRLRLMETNSAEEVERIVEEYIATLTK